MHVNFNPINILNIYIIVKVEREKKITTLYPRLPQQNNVFVKKMLLAESRKVLLDDAGRVAGPGLVHPTTGRSGVPEQHRGDDDPAEPATSRVQRAQGGDPERRATWRGAP